MRKRSEKMPLYAYALIPQGSVKRLRKPFKRNKCAVLKPLTLKSNRQYEMWPRTFTLVFNSLNNIFQPNRSKILIRILLMHMYTTNRGANQKVAKLVETN